MLLLLLLFATTAAALNATVDSTVEIVDEDVVGGDHCM